MNELRFHIYQSDWTFPLPFRRRQQYNHHWIRVPGARHHSGGKRVLLRHHPHHLRFCCTGHHITSSSSSHHHQPATPQQLPSSPSGVKPPLSVIAQLPRTPLLSLLVSSLSPPPPQLLTPPPYAPWGEGLIITADVIAIIIVRTTARPWAPSVGGGEHWAACHRDFTAPVCSWNSDHGGVFIMMVQERTLLLTQGILKIYSLLLSSPTLFFFPPCIFIIFLSPFSIVCKSLSLSPSVLFVFMLISCFLYVGSASGGNRIREPLLILVRLVCDSWRRDSGLSIQAVGPTQKTTFWCKKTLCISTNLT